MVPVERPLKAKTGFGSRLPSQYKTLGGGLVEFKVSKPGILRLYAMTTYGGWLILSGARSKKTQAKDIANARKRATEVKARGCDFD